jgi:hypothetical protein
MALSMVAQQSTTPRVTAPATPTVARRLPIGNATPCDTLRQQLTGPCQDIVAEIDQDLAHLQVVVAEPESPLHQIAADIVNVVYNRRFRVAGRELIDIAADDGRAGHVSEVLVAIQRTPRRDDPVVLGTLKVDYGHDLDCMDLFEIRGNFRWPHLVEAPANPTAAELGWFSFHSALDQAGLVTKQLVLRRLYAAATAQLAKTDTRSLYVVLAPTVRRFLVGAGVHPAPVAGAVLRTSALVPSLRQQLPRFWRPGDYPEQLPALYNAPWILEPLDEMATSSTGRGRKDETA